MTEAQKVAEGLCWLFGHPKPKAGWWGDALYGTVKGGYQDGIKRTHFRVEKSCRRCGKAVILARFHGEEVRALLQETQP